MATEPVTSGEAPKPTSARRVRDRFQILLPDNGAGADPARHSVARHKQPHWQCRLARGPDPSGSSNAFDSEIGRRTRRADVGFAASPLVTGSVAIVYAGGPVTRACSPLMSVGNPPLVCRGWQ